MLIPAPVLNTRFCRASLLGLEPDMGVLGGAVLSLTPTSRHPWGQSLQCSYGQHWTTGLPFYPTVLTILSWLQHISQPPPSHPMLWCGCEVSPTRSLGIEYLVSRRWHQKGVLAEVSGSLEVCLGGYPQCLCLPLSFLPAMQRVASATQSPCHCHNSLPYHGP